MGILFKRQNDIKVYDQTLPEDTLLCFKAADGDIKAFETLVRKYERFVSTCVYQVVGNTQDTLDVSQEAFLKLYKSLSTFKGESSFSSWLYRIAKNCALDFLRRKKAPAVSIDEQDEDGKSLEIADEDVKSSPEKSLLRKEKHEILWKCVNKLSESHREIIVLCDINGYTYEQISEMLDIKEGTVKSRLFRARETLKNLLLEENYF